MTIQEALYELMSNSNKSGQIECRKMYAEKMCQAKYLIEMDELEIHKYNDICRQLIENISDEFDKILMENDNLFEAYRELYEKYNETEK